MNVSGWKTRLFTAGGGLAMLATVWLHAALSPAVHLADADCRSCHLARSEITAENAGKLIADENTLCGRCHAPALKLSHPSGVTPTMDVPPQYPLDWKGDLTCSSCHLVHDERPTLIRGSRFGKDLCLACHQQSFFDEMPDQGVSISTRGHLDARTDPQPLPLDSYSLQCMECHDKKSDALPVAIDARGVMRHAGNSVNHPIGRRYADAMSFGGYRPAALLPENIMLPEGKLSCISCHVGYSERHGALVMSNQGSALCLECHDL